MWNSVPNHFVIAASANTLKTTLDKFWSVWEIIYDYHTGI